MFVLGTSSCVNKLEMASKKKFDCVTDKNSTNSFKRMKYSAGPWVSVIKVENDKNLLKYAKNNFNSDETLLKFCAIKNKLPKNLTNLKIGNTKQTLTAISSLSLDFNEDGCSSDIKNNVVKLDSHSVDSTSSSNSLLLNLTKKSAKKKVNLDKKRPLTENTILGSKRGKLSATSNNKRLDDVDAHNLKKDSAAISSSEDYKISAKKQCKSTSQRTTVLNIDEPINLISKLTGCQVTPSKVNVLLLPDNGSDCFVSSTSGFGTDKVSHSVDSSSNCSSEKIYLEDRPSTAQVPDPASSIIKNKPGDVRTIYDVMEYVSDVWPSWSLHILPDTKTFCICEVTRNPVGIPCVSKCIELDEEFNAKVHIYEHHFKTFDGLYNSEEAVVSLINKVNDVC